MSDSIFTYNPNSLLGNNDSMTVKSNDHKLDSLCNRYEEMHSPSTEYTEAAESNFCEQNELVEPTKGDIKSEGIFCDNTSYSARFLQEVSTFEPLIEPTLQLSFDWEANSQIKPYTQGKKISWEEAPLTVSRKESTEAESECEVEEEEPELEGWTDKRDKVLKNLAPKCKYDWKKIAKKFNDNEKSNFTPLVLKQKYKNLTKVSIPLRVKFSHQEDLMIAKYFEVYGCDWAQMATHFTDRTAMMLKNRYYSHIRKRNLLSSMLMEVKDNNEVGAVSNDGEDQEDGNEGIQLVTEDSQGIVFRKFSYSNFNNIFFEFENELNTELYDKITANSI